MNRFFTLLWAASCFTAVGQCDAPFIPSELFVLGCCTEVLIPLPEGYDYQIDGSSVTEVVANGNSTIELEWSIDVPFEVEGMSMVHMSDSTIFAQSQDILTWEESRQDCLSKGGHLATFSSQLENEAVFDALPFQKGFIGLFQNTGSSSFLEPSGGWEWVTGEPLEYSFWRSGEPNNQVNSSQQTGGEDFGEMQGNQGGRWNDIPSYGSDYYVCEFSPNTSSCSGVVEVIVTCLEGSPDGFCGSGTEWDAISQTCIVTNPSDSNFDGCVQLNDLLDLLSAYGDCGAEESAWQCGDPLEYQGYDYATVQIGEQCWFAENLRATQFRDGEDLMVADDAQAWMSLEGEGVVALYESASEVQGHFYSLPAVLYESGICPSGWKVPSDTDWAGLEIEIGMPEEELGNFGYRGVAELIGLQLKSTSGWPEGGNGTDAFGFEGRPAGAINDNDGQHNEQEIISRWWSSTPENATLISRYLRSDEVGFRRLADGTALDGFSIRCIQNAE